MSRRRTVGVSMLLAWVMVPALQGLSFATSAPASSCQGHVCECQRRCPPRKTAARSCHEASAETPACEMSSRCRHEAESVTAASRPDWVPSPAPQLRPEPGSSPVRVAGSGAPDAGHSRIDPYPPRARS